MSVEVQEPERLAWDVHGKALAEVAACLSQQEEAAKTEWFPSYVTADNGSVNIAVRTRVTMPRWAERDVAPEAERDAWDRFVEALLTHEAGHLEVVRRSLSGLDDEMAANSDEAAKRLWSAAMNDLQAASDRYDAETDHGRTQGTTIELPTPVTAP